MLQYHIKYYYKFQFDILRLNFLKRDSVTVVEHWETWSALSGNRDSYGLTPIAICRRRKVTLNPPLSTKIKEDDLVIVAALDSDLEVLDKLVSDLGNETLGADAG